MRHALKLYPDSVCPAVADLEVEVLRPHSRALALRYFLSGAIQDVRLPSAKAPTRADGLWQHTCFEAFVRASPDGPYCEFNLAPSTQWAAYRFKNYREGREDLAIPPPRIETRATRDGYELQAMLVVPDLLPDAPWRIGLSAVIEEANGRKSYWALAHPPGDPDFHHEDCFALELAAARTP